MLRNLLKDQRLLDYRENPHEVPYNNLLEPRLVIRLTAWSFDGLKL